MLFFNAKGVVLAAAAAQLASSHTTFTNLYVDGANMGNGTCVRMSNNVGQATFPIKGITSDDMACGTFCPSVLGLGTTSCLLSPAANQFPTRLSTLIIRTWKP